MSLEPEPPGPPPRTLVLGSAGHPRAVTSYAWHEIPSELNVTDYGLVILDATSLSDPDYARDVDAARLPAREQFARLMFSASTIMFIGEPWRTVGDWSVLYWLPYQPYFTHEDGREIEPIEDEELAGYFAAVKHWTYFWNGDWGWVNWAQEDFLGAVHPTLQSLRATSRPLASNRSGHAVALEVEYRADTVPQRAAANVTDRSPVRDRTGSVILLPPTTEWTAMEAVGYWLRLMGIGSEHEPPLWAVGFELPAERPLAERERALLDEQSRLEADLDALRADQLRAGRFRALLYETGPALETVVLAALAELGAQVSAPERPGAEDGRLIDPVGRAAVLEIKGTSGAVKRDHVRQLRQWTDDAAADEDLDAKGLLVANAFAARSPSERGALIATDTLALAVRWRQTVLSTTQLFAALVSDQRGDLDRDAFWETVMTTDGACDLPQPVAPGDAPAH